MKVAVIGGGSTYTPELIKGFLERIERVPVQEIWLMDIDKTRLDIVGGFVKRLVENSKSKIQIILSDDLVQSISGANIVITQFRVGQMQARRADEYLGKRHHLVGEETTGIGGMSKALRSIPVILEICDVIRLHAPKALLLNFTNPSGLIMEAIQRYKADFWYSAVPMNVGIMMHPEGKNYDLSSMKLCLTSSFGIILTEEISRQWASFTGGGILLEGAYGLSETHTADTYVPRDKVKYGTMGIPGFEADFKIVDVNDRTREMPLGESGEIALTTPGVFKGYWKKPEER